MKRYNVVLILCILLFFCSCGEKNEDIQGNNGTLSIFIEDYELQIPCDWMIKSVYSYQKADQKKKVRSLFPMNRCIWTFWLTMKRRNFIFFILWTIWQKRAKSLPFYRIWKKMEHRNQRMECIAGWLKIKIWK